MQSWRQFWTGLFMGNTQPKNAYYVVMTKNYSSKQLYDTSVCHRRVVLCCSRCVFLFRPVEWSVGRASPMVGRFGENSWNTLFPLNDWKIRGKFWTHVLPANDWKIRGKFLRKGKVFFPSEWVGTSPGKKSPSYQHVVVCRDLLCCLVVFYLWIDFFCGRAWWWFTCMAPCSQEEQSGAGGVLSVGVPTCTLTLELPRGRPNTNNIWTFSSRTYGIRLELVGRCCQMPGTCLVCIHWVLRIHTLCLPSRKI